MYLGLDYNRALRRQAELLRWAEDVRRIKQFRSSRLAAEKTPSVVAGKADRHVARPIAADLGSRQ